MYVIFCIGLIFKEEEKGKEEEKEEIKQEEGEAFLLHRSGVTDGAYIVHRKQS